MKIIKLAGFFEKNIYFNKIYNKLYISNIALILIIFCNSISISKQKLFEINKLNKLTSDSEIILTIKGKGNQPILNNKTITLLDTDINENINYTFNEIPSEILINGNKISKIDFYVYNLTLEENNITIRFNKALENCNVMFYGLFNIKKININKFNYSGTNLIGMFGKCINLISLDLNNFNTTSVTRIDRMFYGCRNLKTLNLSYFNVSSVIRMDHIFRNCASLTSIDLSNFNTSSVINMESMFNGCNKLISLDLNNFNLSSVANMKGMFCNCSNLISLDLKFNESSIVDAYAMFDGCINLISLNLSNFKIASVKSMRYMFENCNSNLVYCINKISNNILSALTTYNLTNNNCSDICFYKYKKIIFETKKCVLNCSNNYKFEYNNICYSKCPNGTHNISYNLCINDNDKNYIKYDYSIDIDIDKNYNKYYYIDTDNDKKDSITLIYNQYIEHFIHLIKISNDSNNDENIIINLRQELINNNLDIFIENVIINENKDLLFKDNNIIYQLTSSDNQKNNNYKNISTINLGECENKLRKYYNINNNIPLLILKIDIFKDGLLIPIIEYEVYNLEKKEKLDLNICNNIKININIPVIIDEKNLFKYNSSNEYYNNICFSYTKNKTDIILKDRRNEYINNKFALCEDNCEYIKYNYNTKKVICECFIKKKFSSISEIKINKDILLNNFKDIKNDLNIIIIKCYKEAFNKEGLKKNIGNYIMSAIILLNIFLSILFKIKGYNKIINRINEIIKNKNEIIENKIKNNPIKKKRNIKSNIMLTNDETNSKLEKNTKINMIINKNNDIYKEKNIINLLNNKIIFNDYELNYLSYKEALKLDKRTYFQYYFSLLKMKHILIFTFYTNNDYNSKLIKIILFLFSFSLYLTINSLFFNDAILHKIYEDQGKYNINNQILNILYSTIISSVINTIIKYLSLTEQNILQIKKENGNIIEKSSKIIKYLIIKLIIFFILIFLFLFIFWYYLTCFCGIYKNTQIHLIKDTLISFGLSLLYPFIFILFPVIFRIISLDKNKECLFKLSKIIQLLI